MEAAIYLRQSKDADQDGLGIERQQRECERLCQARDYHVTSTIVDNAVSASHHGRDGYTQLLGLIERRQVAVVVILRIDRLLRLNDELEQLVELSERSGVRVVTCEGDIDLSTPQGRLIARILVSVARNEMEVKSARHRLANQQAAQAGKPYASRRPFGYNADLLTLNQEADTLKEMARRVLSGHSCRDVAYWLNDQQIKTTTGKQWYPITVRNMLMKKRYVGIREYKGNEYQGLWEPVFDPDTWRLLQYRLTQANTKRGRKYLLTGLVYCAKCGQTLNGCARKDRPNSPTRRTYICRPQGDTERWGGCNGVRRNADALDDFVKECVLYRLDTPSLRLDTDNEKLTKLLADRERRQQQAEELLLDYLSEVLTKPQMKEANRLLHQEIERIEQSITEVQTGNIQLAPGETVRQAWDNQTDSWRRSLIELVIERINVKPGKTKPFYKGWRFDPNLISILWKA